MFCAKFLSSPSGLFAISWKLTRALAVHCTKSRKRSYFNLSYSALGTDDNGKYEKPRFLLPAGALFFGLFGKEKTEEEHVSDVITTIKRSILLIQKEEFEKAEQMLHVALRQAQSLQHQEAVTYIYDVMANLAFETGQHEKAEKLFVNVLQRIMSTGAKQDDLRVIHISLKLAKIFQQRGDIEKADHGYEFCMDRLKGQIKENPENEDALALWAMTLDWYARLLLSQARLTDAYKYFQEAYDLCVKLNGEEHEQTVVLLNDLGTVSCMKGDHDKAIEHLSAALEIGKRLPAMADLGSIYVNLGNVYIKKGLYEEARRSCQDASIISKKRGNEESLQEAHTCMEEVEKLTSR